MSTSYAQLDVQMKWQHVSGDLANPGNLQRGSGFPSSLKADTLTIFLVFCKEGHTRSPLL